MDPRRSARVVLRSGRGRGAVGALAVALLGVALASGCRLPGPIVGGLFTDEGGPPLPTAADCERCHQEVYREWEGSLHARAFVHEPFQRASAGTRASECTGCHAPGPIRAGEVPALRDAHLAEGVTCITCHLSADPDAEPLTMRGPVSRTSPIQIHPIIERDPLYRSSELCGTCHEAAWREWRDASAPASGEKPICQSCHMPEVRRKVESVHDEHGYSALFVALGDEAALRRHTFAIPEIVAEDLELSVEAGPAGPEAVLRNRVPHAVPTGEFGRRELRLVVAGPGGERVFRRSRRAGEALAPGADWRVPLDPALGEPEALRLRLERFDSGEGAFRTLLAAPPGDAGGADGGVQDRDRLTSAPRKGPGR